MFIILIIIVVLLICIASKPSNVIINDPIEYREDLRINWDWKVDNIIKEPVEPKVEFIVREPNE